MLMIFSVFMQESNVLLHLQEIQYIPYFNLPEDTCKCMEKKGL